MAKSASVIHTRDDYYPVVRDVPVTELKEVLKLGLEDFKEWPTHVVGLAILYPIVGLLIARIIIGYDVLPMLFPITAGFALIAPVAALGLYELSRLRENHEDVTWGRAFEVFKSHSIRAIERLALVLLIVFFAWMFTAQIIYTSIMGEYVPASMGEFFSTIFGTSQGWQLIDPTPV